MNGIPPTMMGCERFIKLGILVAAAELDAGRVVVVGVWPVPKPRAGRVASAGDDDDDGRLDGWHVGRLNKLPLTFDVDVEAGAGEKADGIAMLPLALAAIVEFDCGPRTDPGEGLDEEATEGET